MPPSPAEARSFALAAHGDQKYGERPYAYHLDRVAALAVPYGDDAVVIAYLHDTVEDTTVTLAEVESRFGEHVAGCVALLTDVPGPNRKARKELTYARLAEVHGPLETALIVKAADRLANVRACVEDGKEELWAVYRDEHPHFRAAAYRPKKCEPLWTELDVLFSRFGAGKRLPLPQYDDFPGGTRFVIKEFAVPLALVPGEGWVNWYGGGPYRYEGELRVDNNWDAESFAHWLAVLDDSIRA